MKHLKHNPISYFGWLGFIGVIGIYYVSPVLTVFLLFFFCFSYSNMKSDELFWTNVRQAGFRAFVVNIVANIIAIMYLFVRATFIYKFDTVQSNANVYLLSEQEYVQYLMCCSFFVIITIITLCTFFFTLMYFSHKEKKYLKESE